MPLDNSQDKGVTGGAKFVTSTLGNAVGGVGRTLGNVTGAAGRGIGDTITSTTGSAGKPVGDAIHSLGQGVENGAHSVSKGAEDKTEREMEEIDGAEGGYDMMMEFVCLIGMGSGIVATCRSTAGHNDMNEVRHDRPGH
ncbi:hypothetical protein F5Y18DRAFT_424357 [Xylariaceae sp. FL1019]|nr:hypothetical protein F5Y18DRAFT_424357 [Xylariaceae sp. FL1019]